MMLKNYTVTLNDAEGSHDFPVKAASADIAYSLAEVLYYEDHDGPLLEKKSIIWNDHE